MIGLSVTAALLLLPATESITKPGPGVGKAVAGQVSLEALARGQIPVGRYGWHEPSVHFYLGGPYVTRLEQPADVRAWVAQPGPRLLIITGEGLEEVGAVQDARGAPLRLVGESAGLCHVKGRHLQLRAYYKP